MEESKDLGPDALAAPPDHGQDHGQTTSTDQGRAASFSNERSSFPPDQIGSDSSVDGKETVEEGGGVEPPAKSGSAGFRFFFVVAALSLSMFLVRWLLRPRTTRFPRY